MANQADNSSGGGGTINPYTDPGGGAGVGLPPGWQVFPTPTTPPVQYPTGPPRQQSYYHAPPKSTAPPPPDLWSGISSAVHSAASQLVDKFENLIGGAPTGFDSAGESLALAKSGVNLTGSAQPLDAMQWLFDNKLSVDQQQANPWAQFGMDKDTYNVTVAKMDATYFDWTGDQLSAQGVGKSSGLWQAIRGSWLPDQIRNFAIYGNASGSGQMLSQAQFSGDMPWLSGGQTYSQTLQQFQTLEEHSPTDKATLAAFWRFGQSAKQIGGGQEAIGSASAQIQKAGSVIR